MTTIERRSMKDGKCEFCPDGVTCERLACARSCGWRPEERARRRRLLRDYGLYTDDSGLARLRVTRRAI